MENLFLSSSVSSYINRWRLEMWLFLAD